MAYQSEKQLEDKTVDQLVSMGYKKVSIKNYDDLLSNFREKVNEFNTKNLGDSPLSDTEFRRLLSMIEGKGVFASAEILRDKLTLERDDGNVIFIQLFNSVDWCHNLFQVAHQITSQGETRKNRYDVTILINGLPLIQMELKRPGIDIKEAFNQVQRYRKKNRSFKGLYNFIQLFVVSNGVSTRYFANSNGDILYAHAFHWTDEKNERINNLEDFTFSFLEKCHAAKMVARHMVLQRSTNSLMVMRPYQIHGAEAIISRALETGNNGYLWHATGSGKTLTSFKVSQILSQTKKFAKVIFLVDRRDLDGQTIEEFNQFQPGSVDRTNNTHELVKQMDREDKRMVLTTIQKLSRAVQNPRFAHIMDKYADKPVAFIIDECHRSQFGSMHKEVRKHFTKAQFFGFTGTPRFESNKSADGRATADLFEKCLHTYLIKNSIHDGNTLPFSVSYVETMKESSASGGDDLVEGIATAEAWSSDERVRLVAEDVLRDRDKKLTHSGIKKREFNAIFATPSIPMLVKYYDELQEQNSLRKAEDQYTIAAIFTPGENEDLDEDTELSRDALARIIDDYNKMFGTAFSVEDPNSYFADVSNRVKKGSIDLLVVVNMFLTGFDSRNLHALYVDKNLDYHGLIQAFSRTNRVSKPSKKVGFIRCYRNLKDKTDEAVRLFSQTDKVDEVLAKSQEEYEADFSQALADLAAVTADANDALNIESETQKKEFVLAFQRLARTLRYLEPFTDFDLDSFGLGMSEQEFQNLRSAYMEIYYSIREYKEKESILSDIDFAIEEIRSDVINVDYILSLLFNSDLKDPSSRQRIAEEMGKSSDPELRPKKELIAKFMEKVAPGLPEGASTFVAYYEFLDEEKPKELESFAKQHDYISLSDLEKLLGYYDHSGKIDKRFLRKAVKGRFQEKIARMEEVEAFLVYLHQKYSETEE